MSFHASSKDISLENGHILVAYAQTEDHEWNESRIDLNDYIGNSDGWFQWDGVNYSHSSQEISLNHRPDGVWLEGQLKCQDGSFRERQGINLSDSIVNQNGNLVYIGKR